MHTHNCTHTRSHTPAQLRAVIFQKAQQPQMGRYHFKMVKDTCVFIQYGLLDLISTQFHIFLLQQPKNIGFPCQWHKYKIFHHYAFSVILMDQIWLLGMFMQEYHVPMLLLQHQWHHWHHLNEAAFRSVVWWGMKACSQCSAKRSLLSYCCDRDFLEQSRTISVLILWLLEIKGRHQNSLVNLGGFLLAFSETSSGCSACDTTAM